MDITNVAKTLKTFFSQFAPAFIKDSVPVGTQSPYCAYSLITESFDSEGIIQLHIYNDGSGIAELLEIAGRIETTIGESGILLPGGNGYLWLYKGTPFAQIEPMGEEDFNGVYVTINFRNF